LLPYVLADQGFDLVGSGEGVNGTSTWRPLGPQCVGPSWPVGGRPGSSRLRIPAASATS